MANIGDLEIVLSAKDGITPELKKIQNGIIRIEPTINKIQSEIDKLLSSGNKHNASIGKLISTNLDVARTELSKLASEWQRLVASFNTNNRLGIDTTGVLRDLQNVANAYNAIVEKIGQTKPNGSLSFLRQATFADKEAGIDAGVRDILRDLTQIPLESAKATNALINDFKRVAAENDKRLSGNVGFARQLMYEKSASGLFSKEERREWAKYYADVEAAAVKTQNAHLAAAKRAEEGWRNALSVASTRLAQSTMTPAERKSFSDFYKQQEMEAKVVANSIAKAHLEAAKQAEQAWRDSLAVALKRNEQTTMTSGERKAFKDFYAQQEREAVAAIKEREAEEKRAQNAIRARADEEKRATQATAEHAKVQGELVAKFQQLNTHLPKSVSFIRDMASQFGLIGGAVGVQQLVTSIITVGGEIEKQHIALQSIVGDLQNANELFEQTKALALQSPFTFSELNKDVKQLAAYGTEYNDLYDTTKRLADISAGLGVSFERIALAYGQVKSRSWLDGKELRQFAYAGIPLLRKLADMYSKAQGITVTTGQVRSMVTKRQVSFDDVQKVLWDMTDAGGQFYNMQNVLSKTLLGRYNKLKDAWEIMLSDLASGENIVGRILKTAIDGITAIVQNIHTALPVIASLFAAFGARRLAGSTFFGNGLQNNILAAKQALAAKYQEKALTTQLSAEELRILQTKTRITAEDVKLLATSGAINNNEARRLFISGLITKEQYRQIVPMKTIGMQYKRLLVQSRQFLTNLKTISFSWSTFGAQGRAAVGIVASGFANLGKSMFAMMGGLPGILMTGGMMLAANIWQKNEEERQSIKQAEDEIQDRYKRILDFQNERPKLDSNSTVEQWKAEIDAYLEILKDVAPEQTRAFEMSTEEIEGHEARLAYLKGELELIRQAQRAAKGDAGEFIEKNSKGFDEIKRNTEAVINSYAKVVQLMDAMDMEQIKEVLAEMRRTGDANMNKLSRNLTWVLNNGGSVANVADALQSAMFFKNNARVYAHLSSLGSDITNALGTYGVAVEDQDKLYKEVEKSIVEQLGDVRKSPKIKAKYQQLREELFSQKGFTDDQKVYARLKLDEALGIKDAYNDLYDAISVEFTNMIGKLYPDIAAKMKNSFPLTDAEKEVVKKLMRDAGINVGKEYKYFETTLQNLLQQSNFEAQIKLTVKDDGSELAKKLREKLPSEYQTDKVTKLVDEWAKEGTLSGLQKTGKTSVKEAEEERKTAERMLKQGKITQAEYQEKLEEERLRKKIADEVGVDYTEKSNSYKNHFDKELKAYNERYKAVERFIKLYREYEQMYGKAEADKRIKEALVGTKMEDWDFSKPLEIRQKMVDAAEALVKAKNSEERASARDTAVEKKEEEKLVEEKKALEALSVAYREMNEQIKKGYDLRNKIRSSLGSEMATRLTGVSGSYKQSLTDTIKGYQSQNAEASKMSFEQLVGSKNDVLKSLFGENHPIIEAIKALRDERERLEREGIEAVASQFESLKGTEAQIKKIDAELAETIRKINEDTKSSQEDKDKAIDIANLDAATQKLELSQEYITFFNAAWSMTDEEIRKVADTVANNLNERLKMGKITLQGYNDELAKVNKQLAVSTEKSKLASIAENMSKGRALWSLYEEMRDTNVDAITLKDGNRYGLKEGKYTRNQIAQAANDSMGFSIEGIKELGDAFEGLNSVLNPLVELIDALGAGTGVWGEGLKIGGSAISTGLGVASGMKQIGGLFGKNSSIAGLLGNAGPYGAAIGAAVSVITSVSQLHDKQIEKEIEASKQREKEAQNLYKNLQSAFERTLGGGYTDSNYSQNTLAALTAQRDEMQKQMELEKDKKKSDKGAIADYEQSLIEMDEKIKYHFQDMAKELYSIDVKGWASQLADAVVDAWSKGEDAAEAYRDKVKDIMGSVLKNVMAQKYMEKALESVGIDDLISEAMADTQLEEDELAEINRALLQAGDLAVGGMTSLLENMKNMGTDISEKSGSGGTLTSNIQSLTEPTGNKIVSFIDSIRSFVASDNGLFLNYFNVTVPHMNEIQESQLMQLQMIADNTYRNAESAARMEVAVNNMNSLFTAITNGTKRIYVN